MRTIPEKMSDMFIGEFGVSPPSTMHTHEVLCIDPSHFAKHRYYSR